MNGLPKGKPLYLTIHGPAIAAAARSALLHSGADEAREVLGISVTDDELLRVALGLLRIVGNSRDGIALELIDSHEYGID